MKEALLIQSTMNFLSQLTGCFSSPADGNPTVAIVEAAYAHHKLNFRYINTEVQPRDLAAAVEGARAMNWTGFHLSAPHKVEVIKHLDGLGESAKLMGAVNCAVLRDSKLIGENTDGKGFVESLQEVSDPVGKVVTVQDLVLKQVKPDSKEAGAFEDINDPNLLGGTLKVGVLGGQTMLRNYIGEPEQKSVANPGESEVTIMLKGVNAQQRYLQRERVVSIWRTFSTKGGNTIQKSLSKRARILEVIQSNSVADVAQNNGEGSATVTLAVSPGDATKINPYVNTSEISLQDGPDVEPPPSQVGLIELWEGIEPNPMEINGQVEDSFSSPAATNT
jgi:hypothetical protein